jgi:hypothetical protein
MTFVPAGDLNDFESTISQSRDQMRQSMTKEFGDLIMPLVQSGADAAKIMPSMIQMFMTFDSMY